MPEGLDPAPDTAQEKFIINADSDLLTREGKWIKIYPKEKFGNSQEYDVAQSNPSTNMYFEEKNGELYYLDQAGYLTVAQIFPNHPILNIPIPETLRTN